MSTIYKFDVLIHEAKGLPPTGANEQIIVSSAFSGRPQETFAATVKSAGGGARWTQGKGLLSWMLSEGRLDKLRTSSPCVKLNVLSRPELAKTSPYGRPLPMGATQVGGVAMGYALLQFSEEHLPISSGPEHTSWEGWLRLAGLHDAHIRVSATLCVLEGAVGDVSMTSVSGAGKDRVGQGSPRPGKLLSALSDHDQSKQGPSNMEVGSQAALGQEVLPQRGGAGAGEGEQGTAPTLPFTLDAIPIGDQGARRFHLTITLQGLDELHAALPASAGGRVFLSYRFFGVLVQTDAWTGPGIRVGMQVQAGAPFPSTSDTFVLKSCLPDLALFLASLPPLEVCLHGSDGRVVGRAMVGLTRLVEAFPPATLPRQVQVEDQLLLEAAPLDMPSEAVFGGTEMEGQFVLQALPETQQASPMPRGRLGLVRACVTLRPIDEEEERRAPTGTPTKGLYGGVYPYLGVPPSVQVLGDVPLSHALVPALPQVQPAVVKETIYQPMPVPSQQARRDSAPAAPSAAADVPHTHTDAFVQAQARAQDAQLPTTLGLLYMQGVEMDILKVQLVGGKDGVQEESVPASVRLLYETVFTPPLMPSDAFDHPVAQGQGKEVIKQEYVQAGVRVCLAAGQAAHESTVGHDEDVDSAPILLRVPCAYVPSEGEGTNSTGAAGTQEHWADRAVKVNPPGNIVLQVLEDADGSKAAAYGTVSASALLFSTHAPPGPAGGPALPYTLLSVPLYACLPDVEQGGEQQGTGPSIGHLQLRVWADEDTITPSAPAAAQAVEEQGQHLGGSRRHSTQSGGVQHVPYIRHEQVSSLDTSSMATQTASFAGTQTERDRHEEEEGQDGTGYPSRTVTVTASRKAPQRNTGTATSPPKATSAVQTDSLPAAPAVDPSHTDLLSRPSASTPRAASELSTAAPARPAASSQPPTPTAHMVTRSVGTPARVTEEYTDEFAAHIHVPARPAQPQAQAPAQVQMAMPESAPVATPPVPVQLPLSSLTVNSRPVAPLVNPYAQEGKPRRWRLSLDLRSLRDVPAVGAYYVRFSYAALAAIVAQEAGSGDLPSVPTLRTRPAVQMATGSERMLPSSFASFTFVLSGRRLSALLVQQHVGLDLMYIQGAGAESAGEREGAGVKTGVGMLSLQDVLIQPAVLRCPLTHRTFNSEQEYDAHAAGVRASGQQAPAALALLAHPPLMRSIDLHLPVQATDAKATRHAGVIRVVAFLDDLGLVDDADYPSSDDSMLRGRVPVGTPGSGEEMVGSMLLGGTALQAGSDALPAPPVPPQRSHRGAPLPPTPSLQQVTHSSVSSASSEDVHRQDAQQDAPPAVPISIPPSPSRRVTFSASQQAGMPVAPPASTRGQPASSSQPVLQATLLPSSTSSVPSSPGRPAMRTAQTSTDSMPRTPSRSTVVQTDSVPSPNRPTVMQQVQTDAPVTTPSRAAGVQREVQTEAAAGPVAAPASPARAMAAQQVQTDSILGVPVRPLYNSSTAADGPVAVAPAARATSGRTVTGGNPIPAPPPAAPATKQGQGMKAAAAAVPARGQAVSAQAPVTSRRAQFATAAPVSHPLLQASPAPSPAPTPARAAPAPAPAPAPPAAAPASTVPSSPSRPPMRTTETNTDAVLRSPTRSSVVQTDALPALSSPSRPTVHHQVQTDPMAPPASLPATSYSGTASPGRPMSLKQAQHAIAPAPAAAPVVVPRPAHAAAAAPARPAQAPQAPSPMAGQAAYTQQARAPSPLVQHQRTAPLPLVMPLTAVSSAGGAGAGLMQQYPIVLPDGTGPHLSMDNLLTLPAVRSQVDLMVSKLVAREEDALAAWRREQEESWMRAKAAAEEKWKRDSEERERARMKVLEAAWADREMERQAVQAEAQERLKAAEARLRVLQKEYEGKAREAERAKEDSLREEAARQAEVAAMQKRFKEDTEHALQLCRQREQAAAQRVSDAQSDAEIARVRTLEVESALTQARQALLTGPNEALRDAVAAGEAEIASLKRALTESHERCEQQRVAKEEARAHVLRLAQELAKTREALSAEKEAAMEKLRIAWLAREERYVLDGDREVLRTIRKQADEVRDAVAHVASYQDTEGEQPRTQAPPIPAATVQPANSTFSGYVERAPPSMSRMPGGSVPSVSSTVQGAQVAMPSASVTGAGAGTEVQSIFESSSAAASVVERLKSERRALLASGQPFTAGHPLVRRIDRALHAAETSYRQLQAQGK